MKVAVLQSNYIPWKGYFDLIHDVELFVFYDDNQYTKNDWRNRNRIKTSQGTQWLTIPVGDALDRQICEVTLPDNGWQRKHWRTIEQTYGKCAHFARYRPLFEEVYLGRSWSHLSALNQHLIELVSREVLGIRSTFADSRLYGAQGSKLDKLLDLLRRVGASHYLSGPAARDYIDEARFAQAGITLEWKSYAGYPEYPQRHPPFEHGVTVLDLIFNMGPDSPGFVWGWRDGSPG
jgi:hypothetical protein